MLSLKESQTIDDLAQSLYDFLPGKAHPYADQSVSFQAVASELGLGRLWPGGSKGPAISALLKSTLEHRRDRFCDLVLGVVQRGMGYRGAKGNPLAREEVVELNRLLAEVEFKIPDLHDPAFLKRLPSAEPKREEPPKWDWQALTLHFRELLSLEPQTRGYAFEKFLTKLFEAFDLGPRPPFRIVGEQIDGSFQFDGETYLLEATWANRLISEEDLNAFAGKVRGKAEWSRGLFVSYSGFTQDALEGFARGKRTNIICASGLDLNDMVEKNLPLFEIIRRKVRRAAETNDAYVPVRQLFP